MAGPQRHCTDPDSEQQLRPDDEEGPEEPRRERARGGERGGSTGDEGQTQTTQVRQIYHKTDPVLIKALRIVHDIVTNSIISHSYATLTPYELSPTADQGLTTHLKCKTNY